MTPQRFFAETRTSAPGYEEMRGKIGRTTSQEVRAKSTKRNFRPTPARSPQPSTLSAFTDSITFTCTFERICSIRTEQKAGEEHYWGRSLQSCGGIQERSLEDSDLPAVLNRTSSPGTNGYTLSGGTASAISCEIAGYIDCWKNSSTLDEGI